MIKRQQKQILPQSSQSGLTIMECLIAILVVSILMAAIAPVVALSVATRVQARRVELATQAARAYIDGLKSGAIPVPLHAITSANTSARFTTDVAAPTSSGSLTCTVGTYCANTSTSSLYCMDLDIPTNGCSSSSFQDLVIQAFRTSNDQNYLLGLRVYRADGFSDSSLFKRSNANDATDPSKVTQLTFTSGMGNRKAPLVEMTTEMTTSQPKLSDFCNRLSGGSGC